MRKLVDGFLIGFGSAMSIITFTAWELLWRVLDSGYLVVAEADVITAAQKATYVGVILGVLLVAAGLCVEWLGRKKVGW